ncbi:enterotoxin A family protein [Apibacter mensalis]|uniref:enterotoxin A family protein n=1 Tax=Apibacter mensalis TaxID=1586267 RepID=UPI0034E9450B
MEFGKEYYDTGYIYKIEIDDSKGINVNERLKQNSPFPNENEFAVIKKIPNENIKGYANIEDIDNVNDIKWTKCK